MGNKLKLVSFSIIYFMMLFQFGTDLYLPSFPEITKVLSTTDAYVQLTLSVFLFGFAISQLIYGPLSDRYGRKIFILGGMILFFLATSLGALSDNIYWLLTARLFQGLGAGAGSVIARAMMKDCFSGVALEKLASAQGIIWSFIPMIAPVFGSYLQKYLGWRSNFYVLGIFILIAVILAALLPETNVNKLEKINFSKIISNYKHILSNKKYIAYALCPVCIIAMNISFSTIAPFLFQQGYGLSVVSYGWIILFIAISFVIGNVLNRILLNKIESYKLINYGALIVISINSLLFITTIFNSRPNLIVLIFLIIMVWVGSSLVYSNCAAQVMHIFPELAGSSAAIFGCMVFIGGMLGSAIVTNLPNTSLWGFAPLALLAGIVMFISSSIANRTV
ncbi:multidrug effflux MFS transporter [Francisellaceae bacterium]|nr:multidrug effflux MFS transporter [Francisellaceae bacterium]